MVNKDRADGPEGEADRMAAEMDAHSTWNDPILRAQFCEKCRPERPMRPSRRNSRR